MPAEAKSIVPPLHGPHSIVFRGGPYDGQVHRADEGGAPLFTYKIKIGKQPTFTYHNSFDPDDQGRTVYIPRSEYRRKPGHPRLRGG